MFKALPFYFKNLFLFNRLDGDFLTFFILELSNLSDDDVEKQMSSSLRFYEPYIRKIRKLRPHLLSSEVERCLTIRDPWSSSTPVSDYYEKQLSVSMYDFDGKKLTLESVR